MKDSKKLFQRLGIMGMSICAACCLLPVVAVVFGMSTLTAIAVYLEWIAVAAIALAILFFALYYLRKRNEAPACDIDCARNNETSVDSLKE